MPLYKISEDRKRLIRFAPYPLELEDLLEGWVEQTPQVLGDDVLIIGRQVPTDGGPIDLLALNSVGDLLVVELKRARAPRDVIAQALDYLSAVEAWDKDKIEAVAIDYFRRVDAPYQSLKEAFSSAAGVPLADEETEAGAPQEPAELNRRQQVFIVAQEPGAATERMARFLCGKGIAVTCLAFTYYRTDSGEELLEVTRRAQPDAGVPRPGRVRGPRIDEEIFIAQCREVGSELALQLYERAKALAGRRRAKGDLIGWGEKGYSYSFAPVEADSTSRPQPFWAFPTYFQIWAGSVEDQYPEAGAEFRQALAGVPAVRGRLESQRGPCVYFARDPVDSAQLDTFIQAVERLGQALDRQREATGGV
jgi:hypothetical protein